MPKRHRRPVVFEDARREFDQAAKAFDRKVDLWAASGRKEVLRPEAVADIKAAVNRYERAVKDLDRFVPGTREKLLEERRR